MTMALILFFAISAMIYLRWKDPQLIRIEWNKVASFLAFMAIFTVGRIAMYDFMVDMDPRFLWNLHRDNVISQIPMWSFMLVFWEDVFFGMSIYWIMKKFKEQKWIWVPAVTAISVLFGLAHGYQGPYAIMITTFYPFFISYRLGKKYGFGTVQIGHILYDVITFYTILFLPYLV